MDGTERVTRDVGLLIGMSDSSSVQGSGRLTMTGEELMESRRQSRRCLINPKCFDSPESRDRSFVELDLEV